MNRRQNNPIFEFFENIGNETNKFLNNANNTVKDMAGGIVDGIIESCDNFYKSISIKEREKKNLNESLKNMEVNDYESLKDCLKQLGEKEKFLSLESTSTLFEKIGDYVGHIDENVKQNTINIYECREILKDYGIRLDKNDIRITNCEFRLDKAEKQLQIHDVIIKNYGKRIHKLEIGFGIHEKRLNEQDRIISFQSSQLQKHREIINYHSNLINNLNIRMYKSEHYLYKLSGELNLHRKILAGHEKMIKTNQQNIKELFQITKYQQNLIRNNDEKIHDHQIAIIDCIYNLNYLKDRIENDEKVIDDLGKTISKVINYATNTQNIVDGLCYATQLHDNLIIQNHNDIIELKKEIGHQWDYILSQNEILKEVINEINRQDAILRLHDEKIKNLEDFCQKVEKDIKKINEIIPQLYREIVEVKNELRTFNINYEAERKAKIIDD